MSDKSTRDRIAEAMMSAQSLGAGVMLDDYREPGSLPYREDRPGPMEQQQRPPPPSFGVDPRFAPPPAQMLGIEPTNDPIARMDPVDPLNKYRWGMRI